MTVNDTDNQINDRLDRFAQLRSQLEPIDQPRFDDALHEMSSLLRDYLKKLAMCDLGDHEQARLWYDQITEAVFEREAENPPQSAEDLIHVMNRISERVRQFPDPTASCPLLPNLGKALARERPDS